MVYGYIHINKGQTMTDIKNFKGNNAKIAKLLDEGFEPVAIIKILSCSRSAVYDVLKSAHYVDWQRQIVLAELGGRGARIAVKALIEIAGGKRHAASARVSAADKLLQYTGYAVDNTTTLDQSPATMTQAQLIARLKELQGEAASRSKPAVIEGTSTPIDKDNLLS